METTLTRSLLKDSSSLRPKFFLLPCLDLPLETLVKAPTFFLFPAPPGQVCIYPACALF